MSKDTDQRIQPVAQTAKALTSSPAATGAGAATDAVSKAAPLAPTLSQRARALLARNADAPPTGSCEQRVSINLFFDGTGNNLKADAFTLEHSNVARLFRAMPLDRDATTTYSRYIPGIGTRFPDIGDDGYGPIGKVEANSGLGRRGQDRLDWAFTEVEANIAKARARAGNPTNCVRSVSFAVFGFSRGATLARAFVRDLINNKCRGTADSLRWRSGGEPVRIRFMGLWDTVASVGLPTSANNSLAVRKKSFGAPNGKPRSNTLLCASDLAFGVPGADPAPGTADGHASWADGLAVPAAVELCVQMIAAHEIRNSFPVDSLCRGGQKPGNCVELVYPGVHSDVGGGYRPGEGGLGEARQQALDALPDVAAVPDAELALGRIPLIAMFNAAQAAGVPFRAIGSEDWRDENISDFEVDPDLCKLFNHYMTRVGWGGRSLGTEMLAHTRLYLAWSFRRIHRRLQAASATVNALLPAPSKAPAPPGSNAVLRATDDPDAASAQRLDGNERVFTQDADLLQQEIARLEALQAAEKANEQRAWREHQTKANAENRKFWPDRAALAKAAKERDSAVAESRRKQKELSERISQLDARAKTLPSRGSLSANRENYDRQLLADARAILAEIGVNPALRSQLRPHYRNVVETYEAEFLHGRGLGHEQGDEKIIQFFDNHIHDSLGDFAHDATLPSDPRMIYVGGDVKLLYAKAELEADTSAVS